MSLFKRKSRTSADEVPDADEVTAAEDVDPSTEPATGRASDRATAGPFDEADVDGPGERLDVGALWLPLREGVELQLQMDESTGQVTGVFVVLGDSAVQLQAFAAPRHEGIWREICDEIAAGITEQGGTADPGSGPFGHELLARVPAAQPDGRTGFQPLRFTGVDGPRWLLRAVFHGQAAVDPAAAADLEALVADVVVVRGAEPMGPRELLPLHLPEAGPGEDAAAGDDLEDEVDERAVGADDLRPFERGPEITERR